LHFQHTMSSINIYTLNNGIRVIHREITSSQIVHCGFILNRGSRDENIHNQGIAHFWEHMVFKGTHKRKSFHILNSLDSVGGELNAYTTKEKIVFYASSLQRYYEKAFELLTDITFDSVFPERQLEKEKNVILEEMAMYNDSPEDALHDEFDQVIFGNHPLGYNILGTSESVKSFKRKDFQDFIQGNLNMESIVFSSIGNISFKKVKQYADKYLADVPVLSGGQKRVPFEKYTPGQREEKKNITQSICAIGRDAYPIHSKQKVPLYLLTNLLGGGGMNSRLNLSLREKRGFVYHIEANYIPFSDTGLFSIYFGTAPHQLSRSIDLVKKELNLLKNKKLGTRQLSSSKEQLMGQLAMAREKNVSYMLMMGKGLLDYGHIETLDEIFSKIQEVTASKLLELANEMFHEDQLSLIKFTPN